MIKSSNDFQEILDELTEDKPIGFSGLGKNMNADEYNGIMYQIENDLNDIYMNIRMLNDVADYCQDYITQSVESRRKKFVEKLKVVEELTDSFRDKEYVTQIMPMADNQEVVKNREGKTIPHLNYNSGKLEMNGNVTSRAAIDSAFVKTTQGCDKSSISALQQGKAYRTSYLCDEPVVGGVKESIEIHFKDALTANYIDIDTVNSNLENVKAIVDEGSEKPIDLASSFLESEKLMGLIFDLKSVNYENAMLPNNKADYKSLTIRTGEAHRNTGSFSQDEANMAARDTLNKQGIFRGEYAKWLKGKELTEKKNLLSGNTAKKHTSRTEMRDFSSDAIELPDGSILEPFSDTGYQYTPNGNVEVSDVLESGRYEEEDIPSFSKEALEASKHGYKYNFGLDAIKIQSRAIYDECGYVSNPINIGKCSYIELSAIETGDAPVEYTIIDGIKEVPILPLEKNKVVREKLLYQTMPRFTPNYEEDITIFCDGAVTTLSLDDMDTMDFNAHTYEVTYTPVNAYVYHPKSEKISIKILQRKTDMLPTTIQAVSVRVHGGELEWTMLG